jgi:hypothetical protein
MQQDENVSQRANMKGEKAEINTRNRYKRLWTIHW